MNQNIGRRKRKALTTHASIHLLIRRNIQSARRSWPISKEKVAALKSLTKEFQLSVATGDLRLLENNWYVTHSGLLRIAQRSRCSGIRVDPVRDFSDAASGRWVFKATVYKSPRSRGFVGYGDADPSNVSSLVHGAEMRVAETRAVNRALRKAYGIGLCSVEELGWAPRSKAPETLDQPQPSTNGNNDHNNGQPRLRDQLCLLIRQHNLDPNLVKLYAADFCGTEALSGASRELVESFISHLSSAATENRDALVCKLNSYLQPVETRS